VNRTGRIPFVWSALAALALLAAAATPGVPADEARFAAEASRTSVALGGGLDLGAEPGTPLRASLSGGAAAVSGASHAAGARAGLPHRVGFRLPSVAAGALVAAARAAWPAGAGRLTAAAAVLVVWPAARATIHHHGRALGWSELAGGLPGAATRALPRGGGEAVALALPALAEHARPGARVWFGALPEAAVALYRADGRLRGDLASATSPADADLAVVALDGSRDPEYRVWTAFRTARPVHAVVLDEVPLAFVYARPGAWR
jgi:hypothetical protein